MTRFFVRPSGARRAVSLVLSIAMLATLVAVPAFGQPAATPSVYKPGSLSASHTNVVSVEGTGSLGYLGTYSLEVTGTPATRAYVQSNAQYVTDASRLFTFDGLNVPNDPSTFPVVHYSDDTTTFDTAVTGLTQQSTVTDLVNAINSQFAAYMDCKFDSTARIRITAKKVGAVSMGVYDGYDAVLSPTLELGMADAAFRGVAAPGDWTVGDGATAGTDYLDYGITNATFSPLGGKAYDISGTVGHMDQGAFAAGVDPASGFYTAIKLPAGHDFVLATDGTADVRPGIVSFEAVDGVRVPAVDNAAVSQGADLEAGHNETITVTVDNTKSLADATNGLRVTLPAGFKFVSPASVDLGAAVASVTVDPSGTQAIIDKFQLDGSGDTNAPVSLTSLTAQIGITNATASDKTLGLDGTAGKEFRTVTVETRNVAGTAWTQFATAPLQVYSENTVANVKLAATDINAGGYSRINGQLFDQYNNEIVEWARGINFDLASDVPTPTGSFSPSSIDTATPASPFTTSFRTSVTPGVNVVRATVAQNADGTATVSGVVNIDTRNVGDPYRVEIHEKDGRTAFGTTETPVFYAKVVDSAGKGTSFLTDRLVKVVMSDKYGNTMIKWAAIPAGYSTSADFNFGAPNQTDIWTLTGTDWFGGQALPSNILNLSFSSAVVPGAPYDLAITAVKPIPADQINVPYGEYLFNQGGFSHNAFGYANGDGQSAVEFTGQVVDAAGMPLHEAGIEVTYTVPAPPVTYPGVTYPGVLSKQHGVTDANGQVHVKMTSTIGSRVRFAPLALTNNYLYETYFTPVSFESTLPAAANDYGFAYFVRGQMQSLTSDKDVVLADGQDSATLTAVVKDQAFGLPAAGWDINFKSSTGNLSANSVTTDADGKASVKLTSTSTDDAVVTATDVDGDTMSAGVQFSDLRMNVVPVGSGTAQGGYGATQDVKVTFSRLDGTPVYFTGLSWNNLQFEGGDVSLARYEDTTTPEGVAHEAAIYTVQLAGDNAIGTFNLIAGSAQVSRNQGIFQFDDKAPQTVTVPLTFNNTATFSASAVLGDELGLYNGNAKLNYLSGAGFNKPVAPALHRDIEVVIDGESFELPSAIVRADGSIAPSTEYVWQNLSFLVPGQKYDMKVDGLLFPQALSVSNWAKSDVTVTLNAGPGASAGTVRLYGSVFQTGYNSSVRTVDVYFDKWDAASGSWVPAGEINPTHSGTNGQYFSADFVPATNSVTFYRARVNADLEFNEGVSGTQPTAAQDQVVEVRGKVVIPASVVRISAPSSVKANKWFMISGTTNLVKSGSATITIQRASGSKWVSYKTYRVSVSGNGGFHVSTKLPRGTYKLTASYGGGSASRTLKSK